MDCPHLEVRPSFEYVESIPKNGSITHRMIPTIIDEDSSLTKEKLGNFVVSSYNSLLPSITQPPRVQFLVENLFKVSSLCNELNFEHKVAIIAIAFDLLQAFARNKRFDISIDKTNDNQIVFHTSRDGRFHNLIIDEDGDIQFMLIGRNVGEERFQFFSKEEGYNYHELTSLL